MKAPVPGRKRTRQHAFHIPSGVTGNAASFPKWDGSLGLDVRAHFDASWVRFGDHTNQSPPQLSRWRDRSIWRNDVTQSLTAQPPQWIQNGKGFLPVVRMDGTRCLNNSKVALGELINGLWGGVTAVFRKRNTSTGGALVSCQGGGTNAVLAVYPYYDATNTHFDLGNRSSGGRQTITQNYSGNWHVETWQRRGGRYAIYRDGQGFSAGEMSDTSLLPAVTAMGNLFMGYDATGTPTQGFIGDVAEIIIHRNPVPHSQIWKLHALLREKWGIGGYPHMSISPRGMVARWDANDLEKVDGQAVTNWPANHGGSGYTFDTVTGTGPTMSQTWDGMWGVLFGGAGGLVTSASVDPFASSNALTCYAVVRPGAQTQTFAPILAHEINTNARNFVWTLRNGSNPNNYWAQYDAASGTLTTAVSTAQWDGGKMIMVARRNGNTLSHMLDFNTYSAHTVGSTWTTYSDPLSLGVKDNVDQSMVGTIHELILCNTNHSDAEMDNVRRLLAKKWNCSSA